MCSGDLAVLLAAAWPVRRLALFSLLSALLGYVGVLIGTVLGHQWAQHSPWILTLTAGVFLYVALTDMVRTVALDHIKAMFDLTCCMGACPHDNKQMG